MRIFGSVDSFIEGSSRDLRLGRVVANSQFLQALIRHGSFDAYHLFCASVAQMRLVERSLSEDLSDVIGQRRVMLSSHLLVHQHLLEVPYAAFHVGGWGLYLPRLAYLRARTRAAGGPGFPLTGVTHSLHTADIFPKMREILAAPFSTGDALVCTSAAGREVIRRHFAEAARRCDPAAPAASPLRLVQIPLGVDEACFHLPERGASREALGLPPGAPVALYLGRLSAHTKADLTPLLYGFARLVRGGRVPADSLLVLAGGSDAANLAALQATLGDLALAGQVRLHPNGSDAEKRQLFAAADLFVSPIDNYQETFGLAVVEAMAAGLPALVSDFDGYRELVADGVTGYTVPTCGGQLPPFVHDLVGILDPNLTSLLFAQTVAVDAARLEQRLAALLTDPELRRRLGQAGRLRARDYAWPRVIAAYERLWDELAEQARAAPAPPVHPAPASDPHTGDLHAIFGHYPSAQLGALDRLRLAPLGREVLERALPMPPLYEDLQPLVPPELAPALLGLLAAEPQLTVADCTARLEGQLGVPAPWTLFQLIWLLKQGLLERHS